MAATIKRFDIVQILPETHRQFDGMLMVVLQTDSPDGYFGYIEAPLVLQDPDDDERGLTGLAQVMGVTFYCHNGKPRAFWLCPKGRCIKVGTMDFIPDEVYRHESCVPMLGFTQNRLYKLPVVEEDGIIECRRCGHDHRLVAPTDEDIYDEDKKLGAYQCGNELMTPKEGLLTYTCQGKMRIGAIKDDQGNYRLIAGMRPSLQAGGGSELS